MAAYNKQQPQASQQQPSPGHLNAAYYGPAIPPPSQPAYYGGPPPSAPRRRGAGCFFCFLLKFIAVAAIALGVAILVLWLVFRPTLLKATADSATLSRFDLSSNNQLQYNLTVNIRLRNPNRFGIRYDWAEARAFYNGDDYRFGYASLRPFYLERKSDETVTAAFNAVSVVTGDDEDDVRRTHTRETREGFYYVKVRLYSDLSFKVRVVRRTHYRSKITCDLRLPVPPAGGSAPAVTTNLGTRCHVDF